MKNVAIIATSLNPESKSQILARKMAAVLSAHDIEVEAVDLRESPLPFAGTPGCWEDANAARIKGVMERASHVVLAVPVYCYDANAAAKNLVELMGHGFDEKVVAFMCAAGGQGSYMSVMGLANHLMLDFRSVIVPRFVYATGADWSDEGELSAELEGRIELLYEDMKRVSVAPA